MQARTKRWPQAAIVVGALLTSQAAAQPTPGLSLTGRAVTGADTRQVKVNFGCSSNSGSNLTGALSVELEVPNVAQLARLFDFDDLEGPDANAGPRSHLTVTAGGSTAQGSFTAAGFVPAAPATSFTLGINAALRRDTARLASLARVLRPFTSGPATLQWRQDSSKPAGTPILVDLDVSAADAARLKTLIAPCLAARG